MSPDPTAFRLNKYPAATRLLSRPSPLCGIMVQVVLPKGIYHNGTCRGGHQLAAAHQLPRTVGQSNGREPFPRTSGTTMTRVNYFRKLLSTSHAMLGGAVNLG